MCALVPGFLGLVGKARVLLSVCAYHLAGVLAVLGMCAYHDQAFIPRLHPWAKRLQTLKPGVRTGKGGTGAGTCRYLSASQRRPPRTETNEAQTFHRPCQDKVMARPQPSSASLECLNHESDAVNAAAGYSMELSRHDRPTSYPTTKYVLIRRKSKM